MYYAKATAKDIAKINKLLKEPMYIDSYGQIDHDSLDDLYYNIADLPGCCGIAVIHDFCTFTLTVDDVKDPRYLEEARILFWETLLKIAEKEAKSQRYSRAIASHITKEEGFREAMAKRKWVETSSTKNKRTGNTIIVYQKKL